MASSWPRIAPVAFDDTARLIPGPYDEDAEHALADLAATDHDLELLVTLSGVTNSRLQAQEERHPGGLGRAQLVFHVPYSKIVNASFAYVGMGARFHNPDGPGAWCCAREVETALAEVAWHRARALAETGLSDESDVPYRAFLADIHAQDFAWLDDRTKASRSCLDADSYAASQQLALRLRAGGVGGVVYPAVRRAGGTNLAVLQAPIVANVRRDALYHLTIRDGRLANVVRAG